MSAAHSLTVPTHSPTTPTSRGAPEVPEHVEVQAPQSWFLPFTFHGVVWHEQRGY